MYPPHHLGGYELMWQSAVEAFQARGHEVRVLTSGFRLPGIEERDGPVYRELSWYWRDHGFPSLSLRERLRLERANQSTLARHLAEWRPDVVSFWAMGGMSLALVEAVRRGGFRTVGVVHEDWMVYGPRVDGWQRAFGRPALSRLAELATGIPTRLRLDEVDAWLFNSEATRAAARSRWELPRTAVITPGVDLDLFEERPASEWSGRLLYVGRIDPRKGIATAIQALSLLPDARLRIVGSGDAAHLEDLHRLAREPGLDGRVAFDAVSRERLPEVYGEADAVLFPVTWEEPWGLVPLEAMAVGTPVIATGRGGSGEYLRDGENALLFAPAESPEALAGAVNRLAADAGLRERLRAGGARTAARHSLARFAEAIVAAHEEVLR